MSQTKFKTLNVSEDDFIAFRKLIVARCWGTVKNGFAQLVKEAIRKSGK